MSTGTKTNFSFTLGAKIWTASSFSTSSSSWLHLFGSCSLKHDSDDDDDVGDDDVDNIDDDDQNVDDAGDDCCQASLGTNTYRNLICLLGKPHLHPSTNTTTPTPFFLKTGLTVIFPSQDFIILPESSGKITTTTFLLENDHHNHHHHVSR